MDVISLTESQTKTTLGWILYIKIGFKVPGSPGPKHRNLRETFVVGGGEGHERSLKVRVEWSLRRPTLTESHNHGPLRFMN